MDAGSGPEPMLAVYVPTNHLYLGDIVICKRDRATFPDISVEEGIRIFLTGGMGLPARVRRRENDDRAGTSGYNPVLCASAVRASGPLRAFRVCVTRETVRPAPDCEVR